MPTEIIYNGFEENPVSSLNESGVDTDNQHGDTLPQSASQEVSSYFDKNERRYRRVDSSLYKDIILDTSKKMGWNTNGLNDYEVNKIYENTGGNVETLYKLLLRKAGGDLSTLTSDVMIKNLDKYGVVDKINTPKTKEYINWDEIAKNIGTLEVDKDMTFSPNAKRILSDDDKRKQEKIIDEIDAIYAQNGELTPIQKEVIANRRLNRSKQEILKSVGATPRGQQLFDEEFKKIASDLNLDISNGRFQVKKSDIDAYGAFNRAAELSQVLGKKENIEDTIFHFYAGAVSSNEDLKREGKYKSEDTGFWSRIYKVNQSVNPTGNMIKEVFSGDLDVTNDGMAQAFNQSTIDLYDKWRESKERSSAGNFATGIWEGIKGSVESNVDMLKGALKARRFMDLRGKMEKIKSTLPNDMNVYEKQQEILSNLTLDERRLLESASNYYGALETINSDLPKSMNIGESIGASLAFMAEFIGTGGTGWLKSAAKAGVKVAAKGIAKSAAKGGLSKIGRGAEKVAERMAREGTPIANKFLNAMVNFAKNQAFAVPEAAIQSVIQPSFWNEVGERILTGDDMAKAFGNTLYDRTIENWSERVFVGGGGFGKLTGSALNFEKLKGFSGIINTAKGIGEEYAEELIGDAARRVPWTGKESFSQAYKNYWGEDKWDTFLSVAFMTGALGGAGHVYNKAVKIKYDGAVNITRNAIPEMLADDVDRLLDSGDINSKETLDALAGLIESSSRANNIPFNKLESNVNRYIVTKLNQKGFELSRQNMESGEKAEAENKPQDKMLLNGKEVAKIEVLGDGKSKITDIEGNVAYLTEEQVKGYDENGVFVGKTGDVQNFTTDKEGNLVRVEKNTNFGKNISDNEAENRDRGISEETQRGISEVGIQREGGESGVGRNEGYRGEQRNSEQRSSSELRKSNSILELSEESQRNLSENTYLQRPHKNGRPSYEPVKLRSAGVEEFAEATRVGKQDNPHGAFVDLHTPEEYEKMKVRLLSEDGKSGIAVEEDGNIVNLFSANSSTNGSSRALFIAAIENGGVKGDNFGPRLTDLYTQMGAIPVARVKFNDEFAPDGWNYEQDGRPDIIFWMHNGESASEVAKKIGSYEQVDVGALPLFDSYDEAAAYRDKLLEDRKKSNGGEAKTEPTDDLKKRLDSIVSDHIEQEKSKIRDREEKNTERELDEIRWNISRRGIIVNVDGKRVRVSKTRKGGYNTKNQKAIDAFEKELDRQIEQEKPRVQSAMEERIKGYDSTIDKEVESYRRKLEEGNITPSSPMNAKSQTGGVSISQANEIKKKVKEAYNKGKGEITDKINSVQTALHAYNRLGQLSDKQYKDILKKLSQKNADVDSILDNIDNMIIDNAFKERAYAAKMKQQKQADVIRKKISKMMLPEWTNHDVIEEFITLDTDNMNAPMLGQYESIMNNLAKQRPEFSRFIPDFIAKHHEENAQDATPKKSNIESNLEKLQERIKRINNRIKGGDETLFRFIGEKGAANLDKAEEATTRLDNLGVAREMEKSGKDAKAIKLATGWERGADGKWRYETLEGKFDYKGELHPERFRLTDEENQELEDAFNETIKAFEKGSIAYKGEIDENTDMADIYEAGGMERNKAERIASLEHKENQLSKAAKHLDDYFEDEQLYIAYPQLKDIKVRNESLGNIFKLGSYNPETNEIVLGDTIDKGILFHEVQHAIQRIEGFSVGGSPSTVRGNLDGTPYDKNLSNNELYNRLAGEVEARNVQSRMNMTPEERRNSLASETEDVAREDQIFLNDAMGVSASMDTSVEKVNRRFNEELDKLTKENADNIRLALGNPSSALRSAGIPIKPLVLYGNKLMKKAKKHGFDVKDVKDLPNALQRPIGIFSGSHPNSYAILTEMNLGDKKVLVSVETNKDGEVDFNLVSSVFGKNDKGVIKWILDGKLRNVDKGKALAYISASAPIADATYKKELDSATNIVKNFENPTVLDGEISSAIDELSDELGVSVNRVKSRNDLPEGIQRQMKNGRYPGLFDPKTGQVYMVLDEITDAEDAQATMLHEIVGHKGIRGLFGDKIGEFASRVLDSMPEAERKKWVDRYNGNEQLAAEEYVARFAEGYENPSMWEKIKAIFRDLLRNIGIDLKLRDNDLKYILWKAKNGLKKNDGTLDGIRKSIKEKNIEQALFRTGEGFGVNTIEEYRNVSREVTRLKSMAARWYENELGKIDEGAENYEESVNTVNNSYQSLLNDIESTQEHLKDAGNKLKKGIIEGIFNKDGSGMLMEAMEADGLKDTPFEEKLKEIKRFGVDLKGFDNLELKDLINLETALFNASIGVPTQDIFTISSKLRANEMQKRLQKSREKIERASLNPRVSKLLDDIERLKDIIDIHDFSMVDAIFDAGGGKDLYEDFFVPQIESAVVRMDKEKALTLKDFGDEMQKLENFFVLSRLTNGTSLQKIAGGRSQRYRDLVGMIMTQLDYESNVSVPFEELPDEKKDYFGYVINKTNAPKDLKNRTKDAHQFMRFDKDGKLDVEKTLSDLGNKELSGILRGIIDVARKTLDGKMRQYYIANAVRRGVNMKMMNNYFPRFVKKSLAAKTDGEIDFQNIYSSGKLMPTTLPSSLNKRMAKATPNPVEIDIARVMKRATDETLTDYFLAPAFSQANSALIQAEKQGGKAANAFAVLREATRDRLIKNYRREISKDDISFMKDIDRAVAKTARTLLLAKVPKTIAEFASNQIGSLISDGTAGWSYWGKIDVLHELADVMNLTSSKNIMKYNEIFRDASGKKMSWGEKGVTNLITINDTWTSSAIYYKTFNKLFEQYSGQKFDYDRARTDDEYRKWVIEDHNGERSYFERAHIGALTRAQESFTTVNRALGATHTKFLFGKGKMDVDSSWARAFGFMMSFNSNEHFEFVRGARELGIGIWNKDGKLVRDGIGRMASRFVRGAVYSASMQQIGNLIASGLRDDKEPEWAINPNLLAGTCVNLALGRYGNTGGVVLNLGLGLLNYWDKKINGNTKLTKSVVRAINDGAGIYAKPMSTGIPTLKSIEKVFPHWGFMMNIFIDSADMAYDVYKKMEHGKDLSDDEQMLWGIITMMNAILTMIYPNPVTTTGFNVGRTVSGSIKREKYENKSSQTTNTTWTPIERSN